MMVRAHLMDIPVYITKSASKNNAVIAKVSLPVSFSNYSNYRLFVDPDTRTLTIILNQSGEGLKVINQEYPRPLVLITKALRMLHIDPDKMRKVVLKGTIYPDRVVVKLPEGYEMKATADGYEVPL